MKLLLYTPCYPPDTAAFVRLIHELAHDMHAAGNEVTVISSTTYGEPGGLGWRFWKWEDLEGIRVLRINTFPARGKGLLRKAMGFILFTVFSLIAGLCVRRPSAIFAASTPPTMGLVGGIVALLRRIPLVYNVQDIFPDVAIKLGLLKSPLLIRLSLWMERVSYVLADRVTVIGDPFQETLVQKGVPQAKVVVIPNWIDTDALTPPPKSANRFRKDHGLQAKFVVLYAGNFGFSQGLETLVDAAAQLKEIPDLALLLIGDGERRSAVVDYVSAAKLENVRILPFQPAANIHEVFGAADIGIVPLKHGLSAGSVPSKTWTMMAAGLPIVAAIDRDSELATMVVREGTGLVVQPESPRELSGAIRTLRVQPELLQTMGERARRYTVEHLSRKTLTGKYGDLFRELIQGRH